MTRAEDNAGPLRVLISQHQGSGSGSVTSTLALASGLARRGVTVRLVCPPGSALEQAARMEPLDVHPLPLARQNRFQNARSLAKLLDRAPVDLVNPQSSRDREAFTWLGLRRRLGVPAVFTRRNFPHTSRLESWLARKAARLFIAVSEPVAAELERSGVPRRQIRVVPNALVADRIDRAVTAGDLDRWRERVRPDGGRRTVGVVSRMKDQEVVVRALSRVATPTRLVLAGVEPPAAVRFLPLVPDRHELVVVPYDPDVRPLYDLLEVVLHPSRRDAMPQAVLEAMALGKPVIASHASGNAVIIRDGVDGLLVPPEDAGAWAAALDRVLDDPGLAARLGSAATIRARRDFSLEKTVDATLAVYRDLLDRTT